MSKTKEDLINLYGQPTQVTTNEDAFFAHSYQEDCFLMGGGREMFDERVEWTNHVAYLRDHKLLKLF